MDFLETLASDCNFNLSSSLFAELSLLPEDSARIILNDLSAVCKQDGVEELKKGVWDKYPGIMGANDWLRIYVPPVLLLFGTFGNVISFFILAKSMFRVGTYSFLTVLSVMDIFVLYIGLLRMWLSNYTEDIQHRSDILCKFVTLFGYVCSDISVWLIVAVTVERFLVVNLPLRAQRMCTARRARWIIAALFLMMCVLNAHFVWTVELNRDSGHCDAASSYEFLVKKLWPWVDAAVYSMVPFLIILVLNLLIIRKVRLARKKRKLLQMHPRMSSTRRSLPRKILKQPNEHGRNLTSMLLIISFGFVITTLPMTIFTIVNAIVGPGTGSQTSKDELFKFATFTLARSIVELLMYLNHSMNFFLYCAMGEKFRQQFRLIITRCVRSKRNYVPTNVQRRSTTSSFRLSKVQSIRRSTFIDMRD